MNFLPKRSKNGLRPTPNLFVLGSASNTKEQRDQFQAIMQKLDSRDPHPEYYRSLILRHKKMTTLKFLIRTQS
jgi:hypothetical protein